MKIYATRKQGRAQINRAHRGILEFHVHSSPGSESSSTKPTIGRIYTISIPPISPRFGAGCNARVSRQAGLTENRHLVKKKIPQQLTTACKWVLTEQARAVHQGQVHVPAEDAWKGCLGQVSNFLVLPPRSAVGTPAAAASARLTGTQSLASQHRHLKLLTWAGKFESSAKCRPHESGGW